MNLPKSPVREICTPGSVGTGGGRPPPVTRCGDGNIPTYSAPGGHEKVSIEKNCNLKVQGRS